MSCARALLLVLPVLPGIEAGSVRGVVDRVDSRWSGSDEPGEEVDVLLHAELGYRGAAATAEARTPANVDGEPSDCTRHRTDIEVRHEHTGGRAEDLADPAHSG